VAATKVLYTISQNGDILEEDAEEEEEEEEEEERAVEWILEKPLRTTWSMFCRRLHTQRGV